MMAKTTTQPMNRTQEFSQWVESQQRADVPQRELPTPTFVMEYAFMRGAAVLVTGLAAYGIMAMYAGLSIAIYAATNALVLAVVLGVLGAGLLGALVGAGVGAGEWFVHFRKIGRNDWPVYSLRAGIITALAFLLMVVVLPVTTQTPILFGIVIGLGTLIFRACQVNYAGASMKVVARWAMVHAVGLGIVAGLTVALPGAWAVLAFVGGGALVGVAEAFEAQHLRYMLR